MTSLDDSLRPLALKLLTKFGKALVLSQSAAGSYNTADGTVTAVVPSTQTVYGAIEEYADNLRFLGDKLNVPSSIIEGDKKVTIAAKGLTFAPATGQNINIDGVAFNVMGVGSVWSGSLVAAYVLHVRRA